ncbi:hypothetical protein COOONC_09674 [Cooperia oncophora]
MGGNVNARFLMQVTEEQRCRILLGLNICHSCSHISCGQLYDEWENGRCIYNFFLTVKVKRLLRRHYEQVVAPHVASGSIDEKRLWSTISIATMDEVYTCRVAGFRNRDEYYTACESLPHLHKIRVPTIFLFAKDDPILPKCLWEPVKEFASITENMAFIMTRHGGHLGFHEGGFFFPNSVSWVNRFIVAVADQAVKVHAQ